jgi:hypothetical protein
MLNFLEIRAKHPKAHQKLIEWANIFDKSKGFSKYDVMHLAGDGIQSDCYKPRDLYDFFANQDIKITLFGIIRYDGAFEYAPIIWYWLNGWHTTYLNEGNLWHERNGSGNNYMPIWGFVSQAEAEVVAFGKSFEILERKL